MDMNKERLRAVKLLLKYDLRGTAQVAAKGGCAAEIFDKAVSELADTDKVVEILKQVNDPAWVARFIEFFAKSLNEEQIDILASVITSEEVCCAASVIVDLKDVRVNPDTLNRLLDIVQRSADPRSREFICRHVGCIGCRSRRSDRL